MSEAALNTLLGRLESIASRLEKVEAQLGGAAPVAGNNNAGNAAEQGPVAAFVTEFDNLVSEHLPKIEKGVNTFGNAPLKAQFEALQKAISAQREFLAVASQSKKPSQEVFAKLLDPTSKAIQEVISIRDKARGNELWNHLSAISEGVPALGWVAVTPTPGPYAAEYKGNSEFYTNKLRMQYKGKDEVQIGFADGLSQFLGGLVAYVKKYHTTEVAWNPRGGDASAASVSAPAAKSAGGPPPPPSGGPPPPPPAGNAPVAAKGADMNALFSQINSAGENAALGLKKVTADMKSKNRQDKVSVVKASDKPVPVRKAAVKKGPAKFSLEGNKWVVENQDDNANLVIADTEPKHTVYIYKVDRSVVIIKGKVNSICIDSCNKIGVIFDNAIAQVEMVNSTSVELQVTGKVPSFAIDKCGGVQLILSKDCLDAEIVTSKSDAMNVQIPVEGEQDLIEIAIPEQFKTTIVKGKLVTNCVDHV